MTDSEETVRLWGALRRYEQRLALLEGEVRSMKEKAPERPVDPKEAAEAEEKRLAMEERLFGRFRDSEGNLTEAGERAVSEAWMSDGL